VARGIRPALALPQEPEGTAADVDAPETRLVGLEDGIWTRCAIYDRAMLRRGDRLEGPAVVQEAASTLVLYAGDRLRVADGGHLIVEVGTP
jgi:N-methylhydantoinase A